MHLSLLWYCWPLSSLSVVSRINTRSPSATIVLVCLTRRFNCSDLDGFHSNSDYGYLGIYPDDYQWERCGSPSTSICVERRLGFAKVGGLQQVRTLFPYAIANTTLRNTTECGVPSEDYFSLIRPFDADLPWFGLIFGSAVVSVWYWSCDQVNRLTRNIQITRHSQFRSSFNEPSQLKTWPMRELDVSLRACWNFYHYFWWFFPVSTSLVAHFESNWLCISTGMVARILFPGMFELAPRERAEVQRYLLLWG